VLKIGEHVYNTAIKLRAICTGVSRTSITGGNGNNRILSGVNLGRHTLNAGNFRRERRECYANNAKNIRVTFALFAFKIPFRIGFFCDFRLRFLVRSAG
jgi:hypothetical protein